MPRILIIEDEKKLRQALLRGLGEAGHEVEGVEDGDEGLARAGSGGFDGIILDLMLPGRDGIEILQELRRAGIRTPVLILSARADLDDRVRGLDTGADGYLVKPFAWAELEAMLRACLRRGAARAEAVLRIAGIELDLLAHRLRHGEAQTELTQRECKLLEYFMTHPGKVIERGVLARKVWDDPQAGLTNVIDVYVNYLRKKLEKVGAPGMIRTVRGVGYELRDDDVTRLTSIRARLTIWYGGVLSLTLLGLGVAVYVLMARASLGRVDAMLDFEFREAAERLATGEPPGSLANGPTAFHENYLVRVQDPAGRTLAESARLGTQDLPPVPPGSPDGPRAHASVRLRPGGPHRVACGGVATPSGRLVLSLATSLRSWGAELSQLRRILWTILPAGLLAATLGGYWLAAFSLSPVERMTATARRVSAENLKERLAVQNPGDELGRLAETLNAMLDRIDRGFTASRQFTADAAHEFRTPVAAVRTEAEVALLAPRPAEEYVATLRSVVEEATRLGRLADRLLALSREDAGAGGELRPLRLDAVVDQALDDFREAARRGGLRYLAQAVPAVLVHGDAVSLRQLFGNLLDNAVKYTPAGGEVAIRGACTENTVTIEVADSGIGIPPEALPLVFDRFFRVDPSRSRRSGGTGLGLSIVKAVAERHGGNVAVESRPGAGSTFRVTLPIVSRQGDTSAQAMGNTVRHEF